MREHSEEEAQDEVQEEIHEEWVRGGNRKEVQAESDHRSSVCLFMGRGMKKQSSFREWG